MATLYGSLPSSSAHDGGDSTLTASAAAAAAGRFTTQTKSAAALLVIGLAIIGFSSYDGGSFTKTMTLLGQPIDESNPCDADPKSPKSCAAFFTQHSALSVKPSTYPAGTKKEILPPPWWSKCQSQTGACPGELVSVSR